MPRITAHISAIVRATFCGVLCGAVVMYFLAPVTPVFNAEASTNADTYTVFLMHADGYDLSTTFWDESGKGHAITPTATDVDTAQKKFGSGSALFDGNADYLELDGSSDFAFGTGDFTVDFWFRPNTVTGTHALYDSRTADGAYPYIFQSGTSLVYRANTADRITGGTLSIGTWYHIALVRSGTNTMLFLDGTQIGSTYTDSTTYLNGAVRPRIGRTGTGTNFDLDGWIDEVRVSKGVARWTSTFTPPTSPYSGSGLRITSAVTITGSTTVSGAIAKGAGTFVIDHPLDPKNKLLYHSFVESPDVKNLYDGVVTLDSDGSAVIELPEYFLALNRDFRYLATPLEGSMPDLHLKKEVYRRSILGLFPYGRPRFEIAGGTPHGEVSWQVTGIRHDPFIVKHPIVPEVEKGPDALLEKGEYLFKGYATQE